jgi:hypothetical protein
MLITVHRQLDLFEAVGIDTFFEVGLVSVEPTHTGRGESTCYEWERKLKSKLKVEVY